MSARQCLTCVRMGCVSTPWDPTGAFVIEDISQMYQELTVKISMSAQGFLVPVSTHVTTLLVHTSADVLQDMNSTEMVVLARMLMSAPPDSTTANMIV